MFIDDAAKEGTKKIRFALQDGEKAKEMEWQTNERIAQVLKSLIQETIAKTFLEPEKMRNEIIGGMFKK